jgi:molecular chaperone DnaJ
MVSALADSKGYYAILGVSEKATQLEIKKAYRRLARKYHPDRNSTAHAEDMIKRINAAYEVLSDGHKRDHYDRDGFDRAPEPAPDAHEHHSRAYVHEEHEQTRAERLRQRKETTAAAASEEHYYGPTQIETPKSRFHIIVEPSLCMAFGSCETLAPKVFVVEKNKRVNPKARVESEVGAELDTIYAAAQTCPTKAIKIIDRYTGEQLFP